MKVGQTSMFQLTCTGWGEVSGKAGKLSVLFACKPKHLFLCSCRWRMSYITLLKMQLGYWELMNPALADRDVERLNHTLWNRSVGSCFTYSVRTSVDFEIIWMLPHLPFSSTRGSWYCVLCILPMFTNLICICSNMYGLWHTVNAQLQQNFIWSFSPNCTKYLL